MPPVSPLLHLVLDSVQVTAKILAAIQGLLCLETLYLYGKTATLTEDKPEVTASDLTPCLPLRRFSSIFYAQLNVQAVAVPPACKATVEMDIWRHGNDPEPRWLGRLGAQLMGVELDLLANMSCACLP